MTYRLSPKAVSDMRIVAEFIGKDSKRAARQWALEIREKFRIIGRSPGIGIARPEIGENQSSFPFGNYLIFYRELKNGAEISRVIHGARQWQDFL